MLALTKISVAEKIRIITNRSNIEMQELAERLKISPQNLNQKLKRNNFKEEDIAKLAEALEIDFEINFILKDGTKI